MYRKIVRQAEIWTVVKALIWIGDHRAVLISIKKSIFQICGWQVHDLAAGSGSPCSGVRIPFQLEIEVLKTVEAGTSPRSCSGFVGQLIFFLTFLISSSYTQVGHTIITVFCHLARQKSILGSGCGSVVHSGRFWCQRSAVTQSLWKIYNKHIYSLFLKRGKEAGNFSLFTQKNQRHWKI